MKPCSKCEPVKLDNNFKCIFEVNHAVSDCPCRECLVLSMCSEVCDERRIRGQKLVERTYIANGGWIKVNDGS